MELLDIFFYFKFTLTPHIFISHIFIYMPMWFRTIPHKSTNSGGRRSVNAGLTKKTLPTKIKTDTNGALVEQLIEACKIQHQRCLRAEHALLNVQIGLKYSVSKSKINPRATRGRDDSAGKPKP
jgi:ribosomal protein L16/L10AE